jgi:hypothetical protein
MRFGFGYGCGCVSTQRRFSCFFLNGHFAAVRAVGGTVSTEKAVCMHGEQGAISSLVFFDEHVIIDYDDFIDVR